MARFIGPNGIEVVNDPEGNLNLTTRRYVDNNSAYQMWLNDGEETEPAANAIELVKDDFTTAAMNSVAWSFYSAGTSNVAGRLRIPMDTTWRNAYSRYEYSLEGSKVEVELATVPTGGGATTTYTDFYIRNEATGESTLAFRYSPLTNIMSCRNTVSFGDAGAVNFTYNHDNHRWLRIRESGGNVYWETSPNAKVWTVRRTAATPAWVESATDLAVILEGYRNDTGTPGFVEYDNLNMGSPSHKDFLESIQEKNPRKKITDLEWPQTVAHRGGARIAPENTVDAFDQCVALGIDLIEIDVWMCQDGGLVIQHDRSMNRTTGVNVNIDQISSQEAASYEVDPARLGFIGYPKSRVMLLSEFFQRYKDAPVAWLVEIKAPDTTNSAYAAQIGQAVTDMIFEYGYEENVIVQSFNQYSVYPAMRRHLPGGFLQTSGATSPATLEALGFTYYGMNQTASGGNIEAAVASNLKTLIWTVNRQFDRDAITDNYDVDAIITDDPLYVHPSWTGKNICRFNGVAFPHGTLTSRHFTTNRGFLGRDYDDQFGQWHTLTYGSGFENTAASPSPLRVRRDASMVRLDGEVRRIANEDISDNQTAATLPKWAWPENWFWGISTSYTSNSQGSDGRFPMPVSIPNTTGNIGLRSFHYGTSTPTQSIRSRATSLSNISFAGKEYSSAKGIVISRAGHAVGDNYLSITPGTICPIATPTSFTLDLDIQILEWAAGANSAQVQVCLPDDEGYDDGQGETSSNTSTCYNILMRANGNIDIFQAVAGSATNIAAQTSVALTDTTTAHLTITVTPTGISAQRNDIGPHTATATNAVVPRGAYVGLGVRSCRARFSNLVVS